VLEGQLIRAVSGIYSVAERLSSITWVQPWPELYALGKQYGVAGIDYKIFNNSERIAI
jgi:hypothetical protein